MFAADLGDQRGGRSDKCAGIADTCYLEDPENCIN
jgi:hypothetical protein